MIEVVKGMSYQEYFIRSYSSQSIVSAVVDILLVDDTSFGVLNIDTGDFLFEIEKI